MFPDNCLFLRKHDKWADHHIYYMNDTNDTYFMENESNALTFLLISHTYLSSLKAFVHKGFREMGESVRDKIQK